MISSSEIKWLRSLRDRKTRDAEGVFVVEGDKMVSEALSSGLEIVGVWRREEHGDKAMERISSLSTPAPSLAVVKRRKTIEPAPGGLCLALDSVRDPGNLGTILRIADWFGIDAVYASPDSVDVFNPKVIQASMGAIFRKNVFYKDIPSLCKEFSAAGIGVYGTFLDGEPLYSADLPDSALIVMGNEANGISGEVAALVERRITIPSFAKGPTAESLNVAVATAVTVSEFKRRGL